MFCIYLKKTSGVNTSSSNAYCKLDLQKTHKWLIAILAKGTTAEMTMTMSGKKLILITKGEKTGKH